jgi:glycosyltransferase involved in cell wall biosynthesis
LLLKELLQVLAGQISGDLFDYCIVVVDNDRFESGRSVVESEANRSKMPVLYFVEPERNIALARNKAIMNSRGDFIALIDDDELPDSSWLLNMYKAQVRLGADGVLGPVFPRYEAPPPRWVLNGRFFDRPIYFTGYIMRWELTRTGNCFLRRGLFEENEDWFLPKFGGGGEDRDFFNRMIVRGYSFVWTNEAPVFEWVSRKRMKKIVMLKRALLRGKMAYRSQIKGPGRIMLSFPAVICYTLGLPLLFLLSPLIGFDVFMKQIIRNCDHVGKICALFGINLVKEGYIT